MKNTWLAILISFSIFGFTSCKKETENETNQTNTDPFAGLIRLGEVQITGAAARARLYAADSLHTGYNTIYIQVLDSATGTWLKEGHLSLNPMMDMGMMQHSSPVENSSSSAPEGGIYQAAIVFTMPGDASQWSITVQFHNHANNKSGTGTLGVSVSEHSPARLINTVIAGDSNAKVFISLVKPLKPKTGTNDFEIAIHKKATMMSYPAVEDYTIEIEPSMPSMGHGSPNNENPVHAGIGHYKGKVNYTMTGLWRVQLKLYKAGVLLRDDLYFEMTL